MKFVPIVVFDPDIVRDLGRNQVPKTNFTNLAVLMKILNFDLGPPSPGGSRGGSGLSSSCGNRWFWAGSGPNILVILILGLSTARQIVVDAVHTKVTGTWGTQGPEFPRDLCKSARPSKL